MAEDPQKPVEEVVSPLPADASAAAADASAAAADADAPPPPPPTEQVVDTDKPPAEVVPESDKSPTEDVAETDKAPAEDAEKPLQDKISQSVSFKEESNVVADLPESQKKALDELKHLIQDALNNHELTAPPPSKAPEEKKEEEEDQVKQEQKKDDVAVEDKKETEVTVEEKKEEVAVEEKKEEVTIEEKKDEVTVEEKKDEVTIEEKKEKEVKIEEKKEQVTVKEKKEEVTIEEKKDEVTVEEKKDEVTVEEKKEEEVKIEEKKEQVTVEEKKEQEKKEEVEAPKVEAATSTEEKKVEAVTEEDGAKTVVAIEESIVSAPAAPAEEVPPPAPEEVEIWGIPLLADERSDVVLLKFLRARDFKVKEAFAMIKNTVRWRKEFGIDALVDEDLGSDWEKVVFTDGYDKEGHPVCYNVFGEFENKELYQKTFSDEEKRQKFIRWRIQVLEKSVRKLDYSPTGISTIVQVNDLKNSPGLLKREHRLATNQALQLLQDNYPEFVAKQIFINVPWWYLAFSRMIGAFLTQRTKSKFVFAGPSKSTETLFKYVAPEQVPVQYGGLSREGEQEFTTADPVTEVTVKPATKFAVEFPLSEKSNLVWEIRVVGWEVNYGAEFVPSAEDGYTVIVQKNRKIAPTDKTIISNSFKVGEPGKVVLNIDNQTSRKKKLLYRYKTKPISE